MSEHIVSSYDEQLDLINSTLIKMGGLVETQLHNSLVALGDKDTAFAEEILRDDNKIDALEKEIDALTYKVIAMRQPLANDLTVLSALSIANDLERMGDHATNIAKRVANVKINMPDTPVSEIVNMGENVQRMIKNVLDAFVQKSDTLAINAWDLDGDIDELYLSIYRDLLKTMAEDPDTITGCSHLLSIAKNIERIGDYVQNIAEDIHFITTGQALERKSEKRIKWEKV
jgi:phosphate transport system protein